MKQLIFILSALLITTSCGQTEKPPVVETEKTVKGSPKKRPKAKKPPIGKGRINSKVDGFDVKWVNLWSSPDQNRKLITSLTHGDPVTVLDMTWDHYLVETPDGTRGYCMHGFVYILEYFKYPDTSNTTVNTPKN